MELYQIQIKLLVLNHYKVFFNGIKKFSFNVITGNEIFQEQV